LPPVAVVATVGPFFAGVRLGRFEMQLSRVELEMREYLASSAPGIGFLGKEQGRTGDSDLFWALDPVDGTANFVRGIPLCAVSLALVDRGQPSLAVVALPFLNARYTAERSRGAYASGRPPACAMRSSR
jgi:myo-inositol-1(or 4)-monophosphatase